MRHSLSLPRSSSSSDRRQRQLQHDANYRQRLLQDGQPKRAEFAEATLQAVCKLALEDVGNARQIMDEAVAILLSVRNEDGQPRYSDPGIAKTLRRIAEQTRDSVPKPADDRPSVAA